MWGTGREGQLGLGCDVTFELAPCRLQVSSTKKSKADPKGKTKEDNNKGKKKDEKSLKAVFCAAGEFNSAIITGKLVIVINLTLKEDGDIWIWGDNRYGQLGNGEVGAGSFSPLHLSSVFGPLSWSSISFGISHVVATTGMHLQ